MNNADLEVIKCPKCGNNMNPSGHHHIYVFYDCIGPKGCSEDFIYSTRTRKLYDGDFGEHNIQT